MALISLAALQRACASGIRGGMQGWSFRVFFDRSSFGACWQGALLILVHRIFEYLFESPHQSQSKNAASRTMYCENLKHRAFPDRIR
jgi:hypothetical protein